MNSTTYFNELFSTLTDAQIMAGELKHRVSDIIHQKRVELNMTQKEFAKYMGVTQGMVSKWESFSYNFSLECIASIFTKLSVDIPKKKGNINEYQKAIITYRGNPEYRLAKPNTLPKGAWNGQY